MTMSNTDFSDVTTSLEEEPTGLCVTLATVEAAASGLLVLISDALAYILGGNMLFGLEFKTTIGLCGIGGECKEGT